MKKHLPINGLGSRIRVERKRLGMTQAEFAAACGVGRNAQISYESGARSPPSDYLQSAVKAGADFGFLVSGTRDLVGQLDSLERFNDDMADRIIGACIGDLDYESLLQDVDRIIAEMGAENPKIQERLRLALVARSAGLTRLTQQGHAIDGELLETTLLGIIDTAATRGLSLSPRQIARIAALLVQVYAAQGALDSAVLSNALAHLPR